MATIASVGKEQTEVAYDQDAQEDERKSLVSGWVGDLVREDLEQHPGDGHPPNRDHRPRPSIQVVVRADGCRSPLVHVGIVASTGARVNHRWPDWGYSQP